MNLTIGCDPELFLKVGGKFQSVHDLLPGTKLSPHPVPFGFIQVDGVAAEFNIHPAESSKEFLHNIKAVKESLYDYLLRGLVDKYGAAGAYFSGPFSLVAEPVAYFEEEYFDKLPFEPKLLGCEPDFNAYTGEQNSPPGTTEPFRTGAGHIHVGFTEYADVSSNEHFMTCRQIVRQLDTVLYETSLSWDRDTKRRTLYGKKGSFRPKHYGVEYRPLSNAWLKSEETIERVYDITVRSVSDLFNGKKYFDAYTQ